MKTDIKDTIADLDEKWEGAIREAFTFVSEYDDDLCTRCGKPFVG